MKRETTKDEKEEDKRPALEQLPSSNGENKRKDQKSLFVLRICPEDRTLQREREREGEQRRVLIQ